MNKFLLAVLFINLSFISISTNAENLIELVQKEQFTKAKALADSIYGKTYSQIIAKKLDAETVELLISIQIENQAWETALKLISFQRNIETSQKLSAFASQKNMTLYLYRQGYLKEALSVAFSNLQLAQKLNLATEEEQMLALMADISLTNQDLNTAFKLADADLTLTEKLFTQKDKRYLKAINRMAAFYLLKGEFNEALTYIEQAEPLVAELKLENAYELANYQILLGGVYLAKGELTVAHTYFRNAAHWLKSVYSFSHPYNIELQIAEAELLEILRNYGKEFDLLNKLTIDINLKYPKPDFYKLKVQTKMAGLYTKVKRKDLLAKVLPQLESNPTLTSNRIEYWQIKLVKGWYKSKLNDSQAAISILKTLNDSIPINYSKHHPIISQSHIILADMFYANAKYTDAALAYKKAIDLLKEYVEPHQSDYLYCSYSLGLVNWAKGNRQVAFSKFKESATNYILQFNKVFSFLSEKEKNLFYGDIKAFFDKFNAFAVENRNWKPAMLENMYDYQLSNKAILFNSTQELRENVFHSNNPILISKYKQWNLIKEHLAKLYKLETEGIKLKEGMIDSLETQSNELESFIQLKSSLIVVKDGFFKKNNTWYDIKEHIQRKDAAIEIVRVPEFNPDSGGKFTGNVKYAALIITKNHRIPQAVVFDNGLQMETKNIRYYRNSIKNKSEDLISFDNFWKPIEQSKALKGKERLYISLDGVYNQISLNTLFNPKDSNFVIDKYKVNLVTNTIDIISKKHRKTKKEQEAVEKVYLVGYPEYYTKKQIVSNNTTKTTARTVSRSTIATLPGTKAEVESINKVFTDGTKNDSTKMYLANDASEINVKNMNQPGILHIATHGFFNEAKVTLNTDTSTIIRDEYRDNPLMLCGVMLSGAGNAYDTETLNAEMNALNKGEKYEDGILTAYEALNLDMNSLEIAVLSACETGLGQIKNGEGVYGFQRALQTAGAKTILMSLWKVDDEATKKLMIYFYDHYKNTKNERISFDLAQRRLKKEFNDPLYWGAFIMVSK